MGEDIGTLVVVVLKARNLRDKHTFYKQDAYAQATLNKETKKTKVDVKGGQHPVWDEELRFPILKRVSDETRKLEVSCWSKEPRADECIGRGTVDITETLMTGEFDDWVPLKMEDGAYRGEIFLEMTYYAKTPPLQRRASKWKPTERLTRPTSTYIYSDLPPVPSATPGTAPQPVNTVPAATTVSDSDELPLPYPGSTTPSHASRGRHAAPGAHLSPAHKHDALPSLPEEPEAPPSIPASLRPGGARTSPGTSPKAGGGLLPPEHPLHTRAPVPPRDPSPPAQVPFESVPLYLRPGGGHTPIPEPHIPPPQTYVPPTQPYTAPAQPYSAPQTHAPPPQPYPPGGPAYRPPPQTYSSPPPQSYGPPQQHYAPPAPHAYIPPSGPPYGYSAPRPVVDDPPSDLPDPYLEARYKTPLPLPAEPPGMSTPKPSHSQPQAPPRPTSPPLPPKDRHTSPSRSKPVPAAPPRHPAQTSRDRSREAEERERLVALQLQKEKEEEERDRLLALQIEKEEEERQRKLREQEERDSELARQLDLELNLQQENAAREREGTEHIPGAW
ncbi:hypothetical protein OH77DRAFT_1419432 [Trametes cingulata]|nr:hypothetical protein OH77DRAFT_1419432 [Trametes cingulata]